jgi:hypothetical protein
MATFGPIVAEAADTWVAVAAVPQWATWTGRTLVSQTFR